MLNESGGGGREGKGVSIAVSGGGKRGGYEDEEDEVNEIKVEDEDK